MHKVQARCWMRGCLFEVENREFTTSALAVGLIPSRTRPIKVVNRKILEKSMSCPVCNLGTVYIPDCGALMPHLGMWVVREVLDADMVEDPRYWKEHDFCHENLKKFLKEYLPEAYQRKYASHKPETLLPSGDAALGRAVRGLVRSMKGAAHV
jgi:hypothetical protein